MPHDTTKPLTATTQAIELLREHSLATLAQRELERRILAGELAAGAKLNEADIAAALKVSRGPVREALRALGQAGLVRVEKNRGVFVREVSLEEAADIYEVRAALEGLIGRLAARRADAGQADALHAVVRRMQTLERSRRPEAYFALNLEFHDLLARAAGNGALLANYRAVVNQLDLYRRTTLARGAADLIAASTRDHAAIVDAVAGHDEALAERLLTDHVMQSRARLRRTLDASAAMAGAA
jgi:DNA-binding GntR family transcriptional regulator